VLRRFAIFAVCFVGTRDLITSILLTAGFIIISTGVSARSREGMQNKEQKVEGEKTDNPAYDKTTPPMFTA
jgi:hypothetical protein